MKGIFVQDQTIALAKTKFNAAVEHLKEELAKLRTGRANPAMVDGMMIEAFGTPMPLKALASVSTPEAQQIQISPFDPTNIETISAAIRADQTLGLNPSDDGRVIRLNIPPLTEERRREISKQVGLKLEETMIRMRNSRHEAMESIENAKKDKLIGEDDAKRAANQVDQAMNEAKLAAENLSKTKEQEIMTL